MDEGRELGQVECVQTLAVDGQLRLSQIKTL